MPASIEDYLHALLTLIAQSPIVRASNVTLEKRTTRAGLVRGEIDLVDSSRLYFRELVGIEASIRKVMYSYHYQAADGTLLFRYDDTPHHSHLTTFPHHKHEGDEKRIVNANQPTLESVLEEIETRRDWHGLS